MTTVLVTSKDQITFRIESNARDAPFDRAFASRRTAVELEQNSDFTRVRSLDDLAPPQASPALPEPPAFVRPRLTLIQGGRP